MVTFLLSFVWFVLFAKVSLSAEAQKQSIPPPLDNANHIFNAIHSSMRQFGSSLNHNGMSFFLTTVPEGTRLYHGSSSSESLRSIGWMAFDAQHALVFAHAAPVKASSQKRRNIQEIIYSTDQEYDLQAKNGFLHSYATSKDLRLVYIDGTSAGKSQLGTLDSQDRILFDDRLKSGGVTQESARAELVCYLSENEFAKKIDGVIRMAGGFEIILCDSANNLVPIRIEEVRAKPQGLSDNVGDEMETQKVGKPSALLRTITSRYLGIGGDRVIVNYDHFVTAYNYGLNLSSPESGRPRLDHITKSALSPMRQDLVKLIENFTPANRLINWQAVVDLVVLRYGSMLRSMAGKTYSTIESLTAAVDDILKPFATSGASGDEDIIARCASEFVPVNAPSEGLAHRATYETVSRVCTTLLAVTRDSIYDVALSRISNLNQWLDWTYWKECATCSYEEFCAIPIWPQGSLNDFEHPVCKNFENAYDGPNDYWGPVWR